MESVRIEILNPKAMQLIEGLQALNLIKISKETEFKSKTDPKKTKQKDLENEESLWKDFSAKQFLQGYSDNEPEYSESDIIEPNPRFKEWKGK